jgi:hypothetical protein
MPIVFCVSSEFHLLGLSVAEDSLSHVSQMHRDASDRNPNNAAGVAAICGHDVSTHRDSSRNDRILVKLNEHLRDSCSSNTAWCDDLVLDPIIRKSSLIRHRSSQMLSLRMTGRITRTIVVVIILLRAEILLKPIGFLFTKRPSIENAGAMQQCGTFTSSRRASKALPF